MFDFYGSFRELKDFERMMKQENIGKRDFKQIEKIHRKNKMKRKSKIK